MLEQKVHTVREVTQYIRNRLETDLKLSNIWIRGEISNCKLHSSGHLYFSLKDDAAAIRCVMFRLSRTALLFEPENGMEVTARGHISVYEPLGQYQFYVEGMEPSGLGSYQMAFEQLKQKLEAEGLFAQARKRALPALPRTVAVVTSPTGAAVRDVLNVIGRRFPGMHIVIVPSLVQGKDAPASIVSAIRAANRRTQADLVLLVRGGGSIEELWAFNTETVARAVAESHLPVLTGVGHETDFTIVDFVADRRAPTPSAAAEMAVPLKGELVGRVDRLSTALAQRTLSTVAAKRKELARLSASRTLVRPEMLLAGYRQDLDGFESRMLRNIRVAHSDAFHRLATLSEKLDTLSPVRILARGYAICRQRGRVVRDSATVEEGEDVEIVLRKGSLVCQVLKKRGDLSWRTR